MKLPTPHTSLPNAALAPPRRTTNKRKKYVEKAKLNKQTKYDNDVDVDDARAVH